MDPSEKSVFKLQIEMAASSCPRSISINEISSFRLQMQQRNADWKMR